MSAVTSFHQLVLRAGPDSGDRGVGGPLTGCLSPGWAAQCELYWEKPGDRGQSEYTYERKEGQKYKPQNSRLCRESCLVQRAILPWEKGCLTCKSVTMQQPTTCFQKCPPNEKELEIL